MLVGLSHPQIKKMPENIIGIQRTEDKEELAMLYSMSYIFINPSLEESFSLVTAEALACGTPVIVLDTSAVKEFVCENNGIVLGNHDATDYLQAIKTLEEKNLFREQISQTASKYNVEGYAEKILDLYK